MKTVIEMARSVGARPQQNKNCDVEYLMSADALERLVELVRADEREVIMDDWWRCVQSDLENGVKSLNERAAEEWKKKYPEISKFAETIRARGNT